MRRWLGRLVAAALLVLGAAGPASSFPFDHAVAGAGVDGVGNRLIVTAYDNTLGGGTGSAVFRGAGRPGPAVAIAFTCVAVTFTPSHMLFASGRGSDGLTYFVGVFDDTPPVGRGPYDAISVTTSKGSGPCGVSGPYPNGWFPVSTGDFFVGP